MSRVRITALLLSLVVLAFSASGSVSAPGSHGAPAVPFVPGEILIKFTPGTKGIDRASAMAQNNAQKIRSFSGGAEHWRLGPGVSVQTAIDRLSRNPNVSYAEPNYLLSADLIPNDPRFNELYGLLNTGQTGGTADADIDADMAWNVTRGSRSIIVGVIDTGVDYNHPDLAANMWRNPGEIAGNAIDDDGNGFVDDVHGYDFVNEDGDPFDDNGHGTHVSGTIGAVGNNATGVTGVNWEVSIMGLKFLNSGGSGSTANAVRAVDYATMMGAHLTSNSWGGGGFSQTLLDAIARASAAEIPFVAAAGNSNANNDTTPHYPSSYDLPNVIAVAASDHNDAKASFSSYGLTSVDIAAPGVNILSTLPGNQYGTLSGTSMATPHVAGAVALLKSRLPNVPAAQVRTALMVTSDPIAAFATAGPTPIASGGRLNAFFAIADPDSTPPGAIGNLSTTNPGSNTMGLAWTATGDDGATGTASFYQVRYSTSPIDASNFGAAARAGNEPLPLVSGSPQTMEVRGLDYDTNYFFAIKAFDEWGNAGPVSNVPTGRTLPAPTAGLSPTSINEALFTGETADHVVTLRNDGVGTLDFTIPSPFVGTPLAIHPDLPLDKDEPDPRPGILGSGGPDASGYRWRDSDDVNGPGFAWTEISGIGTPVAGLTGDDQIATGIPIGFPFSFYGNSFTTVNINTNGWISFTDTTASGTKAYSNQPLPSAGAPVNMLAAYWDDLHFRGGVRVHHHNDGSRFIVQYTGVDRFTTGSDLTFQVILFPSGRIVYQYLTMSGVLNDATIGIQNAGGTDGLTVVFNAAYVHDALAIEVTRIPQWLSASPTSGRIPAGGSIPIDVHIDASGLEGGTYPGAVNINTNDPANRVVTVDVTLDVTGAPDAVVTPAAIAYGDVFLGTPNDRTLTVLNDGTDVLHVTGITTSDPQVAVSHSVFDLAPHAAQQVTVTLTGTALGPFAGTIAVSSDDAGQPTINVPVTANVIPTPVALVSPTSLSETLFSGDSSTRNLRISNTGGSDLVVTVGADLGTGGTGTGVVYTDPSSLGSGGPDGFGYRWRDSDEPGGPGFSFVDISSTGTTISFPSADDSLSSVINMGMNFPLYGTSFGSFKISTNGWLTFDTTYTGSSLAGNGNLPSTSLPRNSIAIFWDDLHLRTGNVKYLNDGTRFIIQYTNVGRFTPSTGQSYTFQAQLYPNGRILMMFGTMTGTLNSATIGIQNATRTIALPVVFNSTYMHNNLALLISRTPDWLSVSPAGATIAPGTFQDFGVTFDATDRAGGVLNGNVVIGTNIPGQETVMVPATLTVIGAPQAATSPASYNFGTVFIGFPQLTSFQVINNGTEVLNVSDVITNDPSLTVEDQPGPTAGFQLAPGASRLMNLRWNPTVAGTLAAEVQVLSDDPDDPVLSMPIVGNAIRPPVAAHSPAGFSETIDAGFVVTRSLTLQNQGFSDLTFSSSLRALTGTPVTVYPELELKKGEDDTDPRPGINGAGGPDLFGYRWKDSDEPGGPIFSWVDISGIGTPVAGLDGDDENIGPVPIGFAFPFYGNSFTTVRVTTNGFLSFTSTSTDLSNDPLPNTGAPENLLAVFWDDLHFRGVERARYHNDGSRFIVQFTGVDRFSSSTPSNLTFQVILYPNGRIVYQYLTMTSAELASATIGIQNATKNDGLQVVFNAPYMHNDLAVEFRPPVDFLSVSPSDGTIPAGGSLDVQVRMDASSLIGGSYAAAIDLLTNDPARGLITVPVNLQVIGIPDIEVQPASLSFPTTFIGFGSDLPLVIRNVGTDVLRIDSVGVSGDFSRLFPSGPVQLQVGSSIQVSVTFAPTADGLRIGSLSIASNDPDEGTVVVPLDGIGLIPPVVGASPASIATALPPGGARTKSLTLTNTGGSDLNWTTGSNIISAVAPGTFLALAKEEDDPRVGILGTGGPDMFGYRWTDSDEPGGPLFDWVDISGVGTPIASMTGDDQNSGPIPIGFPFPFYGNTFTEVRAVTNGWLSFTSSLTAFSNQPLPNTSSSVPENLLAVFWDDLHFRGQVRAAYHNDGSRFIVQFTGVDRFSTSTPSNLTFQVILYPSGKIVYQYLTMVSAELASATVGIQNGAKDDGLTVIFNAPYVHDNLAIEIKPIPDWVRTDPTGGVIPAGGSQQVTVMLNAAGVDDGLHDATIDIASNDPYNPLVQVPVSLNVGLVAPTFFDFDPDVLNLSSNGRCVKVVFELPAGLDPRAVDVSSLRLNDTVAFPPNPCSPPRFEDADGNGVEELVVKFDRSEVEAVLAAGVSVPLTIQGEVADVQWFRGTTTIRAIRPQVASPNGGEYLVAGQAVAISWAAAPIGGNIKYTVQLTRDGGVTWEQLAANLTGTSYTWTVGGASTSQARVRVVATDNQGVVGYDSSDADFTIGAVLMPPNGVSHDLEIGVDATDVILTWKKPVTDPNHGPADRYRVLRSFSPQGPFVEIGVATAEEFRDALAGHAGEVVVYYTVLAANAAGESAD